MPSILTKHSCKEMYPYTLARHLRFYCCKSCTTALSRALKCQDHRCKAKYRLRRYTSIFLGGRPAVAVAGGSAHRGVPHRDADRCSCAVLELITYLCPRLCPRDPTAYGQRLFAAVNAELAALGLQPLTRCTSSDMKSKEFKDYVVKLRDAADELQAAQAILEAAQEARDQLVQEEASREVDDLAHDIARHIVQQAAGKPQRPCHISIPK